MVDVTGLLMVPGYAPPWYGYLFLGGAWFLNRFGRTTAAAAVTLTMFPAVILGMIVSGGSPRDVGSLVYLVTGVLLASILHSARGTALFSAASVATILVTPLLAPAASLRDVTTPLALVIITAGLAVVSILYRDRLERDRQAELRDSEERLRLALEAAHVATWDWDLRTGIVRWSEGVERVFGVPAGGIPGTTEAYLAMVHEGDREVARQAVQSALESGSRRYTVRHRVTDREGAVRWLEAYGRVVRDGRGRAVRTRGAILDVTDRQRIEGQREELIRELEAKNDELERFTYTVSHDLKSPLITIKGFLGLIAKDVADGRTERLGEDIARMTNAADAMQRLLHELLRLSRIGRIVSPSERVPFAEVAREAAAIVRPRLEERRVRLDVDDDLPVVWGIAGGWSRWSRTCWRTRPSSSATSPRRSSGWGRVRGRTPPRRCSSSRTTGSGSTPASSRRCSASSRSSTRAPRGAGSGSPSSGGSSRSTAGAPGSSRAAGARARPSASLCRFLRPASVPGRKAHRSAVQPVQDRREEQLRPGAVTAATGRRAGTPIRKTATIPRAKMRPPPPSAGM